ncbi:hypothetical protein BSLA_01f1269 [Burkholderia stabilis]|nr:hypothetical protein BSLA_01f1269 [Burkholderia stabilis]
MLLCRERQHNRFVMLETARTGSGRARKKKNAAGWPREYSQTPSDEGNKQL